MLLFPSINFYILTDTEVAPRFMGKRVAVVVLKSTATPESTRLAHNSLDVVLNTTVTSRRF